MPLWLEVDPPLHNAVCERFEAVVWWKPIGAGLVGPPPDHIGSAIGREGTIDVGAVGSLKRYIILE